MKIIKGVLFVLVVITTATGVFNWIFSTVGYYFGPFYESYDDQNRNVAIWLFGNLAVMVSSAILGVLMYRRHLRKQK